MAGMPDLAPTVAAWAETDAPAGRDLAPLLAGKAGSTWRDALLLELPEEDGEGAAIDVSPWSAVRTAHRLYPEYATGERELYDLATDPWQLANLAGTDQPEEADLAARLGALRGCAGDRCRAVEDG